MTIFWIVAIFLLLYGFFTRWLWAGLILIAGFELVRFLFHALSGFLLLGFIGFIVLLIANFVPLFFGGRTLVDRFNI